MATGKYSVGICDRCGFKYPYKALEIEPDTNYVVCHECNDGKWNKIGHPQNQKYVYVAEDVTLDHPTSEAPLELPNTYLNSSAGVIITDASGNPISIGDDSI